jgi:ribosomal protein S27E
MGIIALMGRAKSGKNTIGDMIAAATPGQVVQMAFADKLKQVCMDLFGLSRDDVYTEEGKERESRFLAWKCPACGHIDARTYMWRRGDAVVCPRCASSGTEEVFASRWTHRAILQHVATEGVRRIHNDAFIELTMRSARAVLLDGVIVDRAYATSLVVITDCRFAVEAEAVWLNGGQVWRIRRPATDSQPQGIVGHVSETEMDTIPETAFQRVIVNDGTLDDLRAKVMDALPIERRSAGT